MKVAERIPGDDDVALRKQVDIVLAESLDRVSRDRRSVDSLGSFYGGSLVAAFWDDQST